MLELHTKTKKENLDIVQKFVIDTVIKDNIKDYDKNIINIIIEEIFINICNYAYGGKIGMSIINAKYENNLLIISFIDYGKKFNPLLKKEPDTTLDVDKRVMGGLGIFLIKKMIDEISYDYKNNQNILTIKKFLGKEKGIKF